MFKPGTFSPATQHELSVTLDVTWQALTEARRIMRLLEEQRGLAVGRLRQLEKDLEQERRATKEKRVRGNSFQQAFAVLNEQIKSAALRSAELQQAVKAGKTGAEDLQRRLAAITDTIHASRERGEGQDGSPAEQSGVLARMRGDLARTQAFQDELNASLGNASEKANSLEKQLSELEEQHRALSEQVGSFVSQNDCLEHALDTEKAGAEDLRKQLAAAADTVQAFEKRLSESVEQRCALEESVKAALDRSAGLEQALDVERAGAEDLRKQLAAAAEAVQTFEKQLRESEEQCRTLEAQEKSAGSQRAWLQQALDAEKSEAEDLRKQLAAAADTVQTFDKQLRESEEQRSALEESAKLAASQSAELQQALDVEKAGAEDLRKQLAAASDTIHAIKKEFSDLEEQRRDLESQFGKARERQRSLEADLSDARADVTRLEEEKEQLQRGLVEAREEIANRNVHLATEEELGAALQTDVSLLQRAMEQLGRQLDDPMAGPLPVPAHKDRRVIWIGSGECPVHDLFARYGMQGLAVSDPEQALEILSGQGADALITDIAATGIDWLSDAHNRWPDLIIIVTTGSADAHLAVNDSLCSIATKVVNQPYEHEDVVVVARCAFLLKALSSGAEATNAKRTPTRPRLLIADDDEATRRLLSTCLDELGYDTTCVEDGAAALKSIEANEFDVLVTDIQMPGMDGIELTTKAKQLKPRLPIIILSTSGDAATSLEAIRAGAYCHLAKPVNAEQLSLFIERAMLTDRLERELGEQNVVLDMRTRELGKALLELHEAANLISVCRRPQTERAAELA